MVWTRGGEQDVRDASDGEREDSLLGLESGLGMSNRSRCR